MMEDVEGYVIDAISELQNNPKIIDEMFSEINPSKIDREALEKRIAELDKKIKKLSDLYMNDFLTMEELKEQTASFQLEQSSILTKLNEDDESQNESNLNKIKTALSSNGNIHDLTYDEQKRIVNALISNVFVKQDTIEINWVF
jgi:site-specific DNA recombinase